MASGFPRRNAYSTDTAPTPQSHRPLRRLCLFGISRAQGAGWSGQSDTPSRVQIRRVLMALDSPRIRLWQWATCPMGGSLWAQRGRAYLFARTFWAHSRFCTPQEARERAVSGISRALVMSEVARVETYESSSISSISIRKRMPTDNNFAMTQIPDQELRYTWSRRHWEWTR